jgi:hypothetical protein
MERQTNQEKRGMGADPEQPVVAVRKKLKLIGRKEVKLLSTAPLWKSLAKSRDWQRLTIDEPNRDIQEALGVIGDDNPAIILDCDITALNNAVERVNAMAVEVRPALPNWIPEASYPISTECLQEHIASDISHLCGVRLFGNTLVTSNTLIEYWAIGMRIASMMPDPFMVALCAPPNCRPLARIFTIANSRFNTTGRATPPPELNHGVRCFE